MERYLLACFRMPGRRRVQTSHGPQRPRNRYVTFTLRANHALIDGNKRLALAALIAFCGLNGRRLTLTNDAAYQLVMNVASGQLERADDIAALLAAATESRH